jgi:Flp pilus assembly protein TadD
MQDYRAAVNFAEKFVAFNPDDGHAHVYLGAVYLALCENAKADKQFSTALALDPK